MSLACYGTPLHTWKQPCPHQQSLPTLLLSGPGDHNQLSIFTELKINLHLGWLQGCSPKLAVSDLASKRISVNFSRMLIILQAPSFSPDDTLKSRWLMLFTHPHLSGFTPPRFLSALWMAETHLLHRKLLWSGCLTRGYSLKLLRMKGRYFELNFKYFLQ